MANCSDSLAKKASGLTARLREAWNEETSSSPEKWSPLNPSLGQCAVTALIVQDQLGGEIVWAEAVLPDGSRISHYKNLVEGQELDLTLDQFPQGTQVPLGIPKLKGFASTRDYILSFPATEVRYVRLRARLAK